MKPAAPSDYRALARRRLPRFLFEYIDSGLDVVRMLALGADAVLLGRAWVYALAGRGQAGVEHLLQLIAAEMRVAMALTGSTQVDGIDAGILARAASRSEGEE